MEFEYFEMTPNGILTFLHDQSRLPEGQARGAAMGAGPGQVQGPLEARPGAAGPPNEGPRTPPWPRLQRPLPLAWPRSHLTAPWPGSPATWTGLYALRMKDEDEFLIN